MEKISIKAKENVTFLSDKSDQAYEERLQNVYGSRRITSYYETAGFTSLFSYDFSLLLSMVLLLFILAPIHSSEKESDMIFIMRAAKKGRKTTNYAKFISALIVAVVICFVFMFCDVIMFSNMQSLEGWNNPIYSLPMFCYSPLNITILGYLLFSFLIRCLTLVLVSFVLNLVSQISKTTIISFFSSLTILFLLLVNQDKLAFIDKLLLPRNLMKEYTLLEVGNIKLMEYVYIPMLSLVLCVLIVLVSTIWMKKSYNVMKRMKIS